MRNHTAKAQALRERAAFCLQLAGFVSDAREAEKLRVSASEYAAEAQRLEDGGLDPTTLDTIGEELRADYRRTEDKPAYLGDRTLPAEFERQLVAIERTEQIRAQGVAAVGDALNPADPPADDEADADGGKSDPGNNG